MAFISHPPGFLVLALAFFASAGPLPAQEGSPATVLTALPSGLTIPIVVPHALRAGRSRAATAIVAHIAQRIPLDSGHYLPSEVEVLGTVVASIAPNAKAGTPATLTLRFTALRTHGQTIPLQTAALAIANFVQAIETAEPASLPSDYANPDASNWTTAQVGGDEIARADWKGPLTDTSGHQVGFADYNGVYAYPAPGSTLPRALGVFSASARGLYGFGDGASLHSEGGEITLSSPQKLIVRRGDSLLLEVLPPASTLQNESNFASVLATPHPAPSPPAAPATPHPAACLLQGTNESVADTHRLQALEQVPSSRRSNPLECEC